MFSLTLFQNLNSDSSVAQIFQKCSSNLHFNCVYPGVTIVGFSVRRTDLECDNNKNLSHIYPIQCRFGHFLSHPMTQFCSKEVKWN